MGRPEPSHLVVGQITKPHGIKGEVFVRTSTDHPEGIFSPGAVLYPALGDSAEPDPARPPMRVETVRPFRNGFLVLFGGIRDRTEADAYRGLDLVVEMERIAPLEEGEVFYHQLRGMTVETLDGTRVGTVREIFEVAPLDLLEVRTSRGTILIPFVEDVVVEVHLEERRLVLDPPEGLLEL